MAARLPVRVLDEGKLNNLTNCEMDMYLYFCTNQGDNGSMYGIRVSDFAPEIMSKQSFYNALYGLKEKGLIDYARHTQTHDYDVILFMYHDKNEIKEGYINLNNEIFYTPEFKKLSSKEKYLFFDLYRKTSVKKEAFGETRVPHIKDMEAFYKKYSELLRVTKQRIREFLHSLKTFFNITYKKAKCSRNRRRYNYLIGRNRITYALDKKKDKNGKIRHRQKHVAAMSRRYGLKGVTEKFINDVSALYVNYMGMFRGRGEFILDRRIEKAIREHAKDQNNVASAARVHQLLRIELNI